MKTLNFESTRRRRETEFISNARSNMVSMTFRRVNVDFGLKSNQLLRDVGNSLYRAMVVNRWSGASNMFFFFLIYISFIYSKKKKKSE